MLIIYMQLLGFDSLSKWWYVNLIIISKKTQMLRCCDFDTICWESAVWFTFDIYSELSSFWSFRDSHTWWNGSYQKDEENQTPLGDSYGFGVLLLYYWSVRERMGHQGGNNSSQCAVNGWILALKWCLIPLFEPFTMMNTNLIILTLSGEFFLHAGTKFLIESSMCKMSLFPLVCTKMHFSACKPPIRACINRLLIRIDFHYLMTVLFMHRSMWD